MEIVYEEENPYAHEDTDDLAMQYARIVQEEEEVKLVKKALQTELANRALDQPDKTLNTAYGSYVAEFRAATYSHKKTDQQALARDVMTAIIKETGIGDKGWDILDIMEDIFTLSGKKGQLKVQSGKKGRTHLMDYDFPEKKYFTQSQPSYWTVKKVD